MGKKHRGVQHAKGNHIAQASGGGASIVNTTNINLDALRPDRHRPLHQLPAPVPDFVGRAAEIDQLVGALRAGAASGATALICGMGGVGKTQLAYTVAQRLAKDFPDAQIRLDLHGTDQRELAAEQVLQRVVQTLEPQALPAEDLASVEASYRSLLAGKRTLIIADNAHGAAQVRALAPPPGCVLLITSRNHFVLPRITQVKLGMLSEAEAIQLLLDICPRIAESAPRLAQLCGWLPLALRVSASLLASDDSQGVVAYLASLQEVRSRLQHLRDLDDPWLNVEASLNLSYAALSVQEQSALRQLSIFPASFDLPAANEVMSLTAAKATGEDQESYVTLSAAMQSALQKFGIFPTNFDPAAMVKVVIDNMATTEHQEQPSLRDDRSASQRPRGRAVPPSQEQVLSSLCRRSLLAFDQATDRYALHDLVRDFAVARLTSAEIQRLDSYARHYLHVARLSSALYVIGGEQTLKGLALFDRERVHIDAGWNWAHSQANQALLVDYAVALDAIGDLRYHNRRDIIPRTEAALHAARQLRRRGDEARLLNTLGGAYLKIGQARQAIDYQEQALNIARSTHDRLGEGSVLNNLGSAHGDLGDLRRAISFHEQSLALHRELGNRRNESSALSNLGLAYRELGDTQRAISFHKQSLAIARELGNRHNEGSSLGNLGLDYCDLGEPERAIGLCEQSLMIFQDIGHRGLEAYALNYLAQAHTAADRHQRAQELHNQALALSRAVEDRRLEAQILIDLGKAQLGQGAAAAAIESFTQALSSAQERGYQIEAARASWNLGLVYERQGAYAQAIPFLQARVDYEHAIGHARAGEHEAYLDQVQAKLAAS